MKTNKNFAGKIISKKYLSKNNHQNKLVTEITIHKILKYKHIVSFFSCFEDNNFVYMVLELCGKKSMMELHKYIF